MKAADCVFLPEPNSPNIELIKVGGNDLEALNHGIDDAQQEERFFDNENRRADLDDRKQNTELRRTFAWALFWLLCGWLVLVLVIIFFAGFQIESFFLSEKVLIALITSTTINLIGLFAIVIRNLFPVVKVEKARKEKKE